jgi:flagellar motor switch protein FliN/FliY
MRTMTNNTMKPESEAKNLTNVNPKLIDGLGVQVDAFIGKSSIKISQLNDWKAGSVVTLDAALSDLVELRVNGLCVATGELVSVGERFGVLITSVAS